MDFNLAVLIHKQIWWPSCKFLGPTSSDPLALPWATLEQAARAVQLVLWLLGLRGHRALGTSCAARWRGLRLEHGDWTPEAHGRQTQKLLPKIHMAGSPILPMARRMSKSPGTRCINQPAGSGGKPQGPSSPAGLAPERHWPRIAPPSPWCSLARLPPEGGWNVVTIGWEQSQWIWSCSILSYPCLKVR